MDATKSKKPIRSRRRGYVPFRIGVDRRIPSLHSSLRFPQRNKTVGTFAGQEDQVVRTREGKPVPQETGDQGGGQN